MIKKEKNYLSENAVETFMTPEKYLEKLKREKNLYKLKNKQLTNEVCKRERILETVEAYLIQRIEKLKKHNISETAIHELELLLNGLKEERILIHRQKARK